MKTRMALAALLALSGQPAFAAGTYYVGTTVASNSVLWSYTPATNLVKLCFSTVAHTLACTTASKVFATAPLNTDAWQFRISQNSQTGGLWLLNMTANKQALCEAALTNTYTVTCTLGAGLK